MAEAAHAKEKAEAEAVAATETPASPRPPSTASGVPPQRATPSRNDLPPALRLILVGDSSTGKTALSRRLSAGEFIMGGQATVSTEMAASRVKLPAGGTGDDEAVDLQIFDTAGQERFAPLTAPFYRQCDGVMLLYDVGSTRTFDRALEYWRAEVERNAPPGVPMLLMGTKTDLADEQPAYRQVKSEQAAARAEASGMIFCETSARTGASVIDAFVLLSCEAMNWRNQAAANRPGTGAGTITFGDGMDRSKRKEGCAC